MLRRLCLILLAVPLCAAGSQVAHALAYRLVDSDAESRAQLLAATGHGYLEYAPLASAVAAVAILLAAVLSVLGSGARVRVAYWIYALVPPLVFVLQEHLERLAHNGSFPLDAVLEPTFLPGLLLQLPLSVVAYLAARVLLRVAASLAYPVAGGIAAPRPRPQAVCFVGFPLDVDAFPGGVLARFAASRAPPS